MSEVRRPLEGIKVVELATFIAAPCASRFLADLGADVIKIEAPVGDPLRYTAPTEGRPVNHRESTSFDLENANKRTIALNIKSEKGRAILEDLIREADIFITNNREQALVRSGLDYDTLHAKYPKLVYGWVTGYGDKGPAKDLPGFDFTAFYARGGIINPLRDSESNPMATIPGFGDQQVGMYLAAGILAALYRARETGEGDKVFVSLFHTALWITAILLQSRQFGYEDSKFPLPRYAVPNPLSLAYMTKDNKMIQTSVPQYNKLYPKFVTAIGHPELVDDPRFYPIEVLIPNKKAFYEIIAESIASRDLDEWVQIFRENDLPFEIAQTWDEVLKDPQAWAADCFYEMEYETGNKRALVRPPVNFKEIGLAPYNRGPYLGEQTVEILKEQGYTEGEIEKLLEENVAVKFDPAFLD